MTEQRSRLFLAGSFVLVGCSRDGGEPPPVVAATAAACSEVVALADVAPMRFVCVPKGDFEMGSGASDETRDADEGPVHRALVGALWVGATEVTQAQWTAVMGDAPFDCEVGCAPELPAQNIFWPRAIELANRLSEREGLTPCYVARGEDWSWPDPACTGYRVPTETEWEYFARAGTGAIYSFGDDPAGLDAHAWTGPAARQRVHPVGTKQPNAWGLFDVHGNVWEWCWDWYADAYPSRTTPIGYAGPERGEFKVLRGGSFKPMSGTPRSAERAKHKPSGTRDGFGVRLVRSLPAPR